MFHCRLYTHFASLAWITSAKALSKVVGISTYFCAHDNCLSSGCWALKINGSIFVRRSETKPLPNPIAEQAFPHPKSTQTPESISGMTNHNFSYEFTQQPAAIIVVSELLVLTGRLPQPQQASRPWLCSVVSPFCSSELVAQTLGRAVTMAAGSDEA